MDLTGIRTNRGAVVSVHFGRQVTTNIWWEYGWYTITDEDVIQELRMLQTLETHGCYGDVKNKVADLRETYTVYNIGQPYRRDRASHSNLGRRAARQTGAPTSSNSLATRLVINNYNNDKLSGEVLDYNDVLQLNEIKNQTFGIEIEMSAISQERACRTVAEFFGTSASYSPEYGHSAWMCRDGQGRAWLFEYDGSLSGSNTCEMVTPVLNYTDIETLQAVIRKLRQAGAKSSARYNCGVHVHVGAQGMTPQHLKNLAIIMFNFEHVLDKSIAVSEGRHDYCKFMSSRFINKLMTTEMSDNETLTSRTQANNSNEFLKFADVWYRSQDSSRGSHYNSTRYHITNFHSVFDHGTVEFRLFEFKEPDEERQNGLHAGEAKAFIQMSLALMALAKKVKKINGVDDTTRINSKTKMLSWLDKLCMCGSDFATAREYYTRRLTD